MSETGQSKPYRFAVVLLVILILYNIGTGVIVKKVGIPGIFEVEFADKPAPQLPAEPPPKTQTPPETQQHTETTTQQQPTSWQAMQPPALPASMVPPVPGMFWLAYPNIWYGPYYGYYLAWDRMGGFYVWDPYRGQLSYPDPYVQVQRNTWLRLPNSPFNICVEGVTGNVFGQYSP